jgi:hypothetical protein
MKHVILIGILILAFITTGIGCASVNPVGTNPSSPQSAATSGEESGSRVLWGLWNCYLSPDGTSIEIEPLRTATFTANVNKVLEGKNGNLAIKNIDLSNLFTDGSLNCTVTLTHPFPGLHKYDGFDVYGILMSDGSGSILYDDLKYDQAGTDATLLNADGYTRWYNEPEFDGGGIPLFGFWPGKLSNLPLPSATLNPYKIFADNLGSEDDYYQWVISPGNADNRGIFTAGSANSRRYQLKFPLIGGAPSVKFQYAVIATWEPGDPTLTGDPGAYDPGDFPSSANIDEPFFVHTSTAGSDLFYVDPGSLGGTFKADVEVFDWQGGSVGGNGVPNELSRIIVEGDFIPGGSHEFSQAELIVMAQPSTVNSSIFQFEITDCTPVSSGDTKFWVVAESAGLNGGSYGQGFPTQYPPSARRAAFLSSSVNIAGDAPTGLTVISIDPVTAPFWSIVTDAIVTGTGFKNGATVELRRSDEPSVIAINVSFINDKEIDCDFDLKGASSGVWDLVVVNPDFQEAMLANAFTIEVWSDEKEIANGNYRIPALTEKKSGPIILAAGSDDVTIRYMTFDPLGVGWEGPFLLANKQDNNIINSLTTNPVDDSVYFASGPTPYYRYLGGTGYWEGEEDPDGDTYPVGYQPVQGCRTDFVVADFVGRTHIFDNSIESFGWLIHCRATSWNLPITGWDFSYDLFQDGFNDEIYTEGNIYSFDPQGNIYVTYIKDAALNPYSPNPNGTRSIRMAIVPDSGYSYGYYEIEQATGAGSVLDSPAITVDPNGKVHSVYRKLDISTNQWKIGYEYSTDQGQTWTPGLDIWDGVSQPGKGYVYLISDSKSYLHSVYISGSFMEYKESVDGLTWSDAEYVNPDGDTLPPGTADMTPEVMITGGDIMHIAWIRGNASTGYGSIYHRMRDLQ